MGQHGDETAALAGKPLQCRGGLGHLHQGQDALLHPRAAAGGEEDQRELVLPGVFDQPRHLLPQSGAHAAHEEAAVQGADGHFAAADAPQSGHHALPHAGAAAGLVQLVLVLGKLQGIVGDEVGLQLPEDPLVQHQAQPVVGAHRVVIAAQGADIVVVREIPARHQLAALGAGLLLVGGHDGAAAQGLQGQQLLAALGEDVVHTLSASPLTLQARSVSILSSRNAVL